MKKKFLILIAMFILNRLTQTAVGYTADFTLYNETGSKGLIKVPGGNDFQKMGLKAHVPLWQLNPARDDAVVIKFRGKAAHALMNKTFRIKPANAAKWGDLPKGRIELRAGSSAPLTASLEYKDADDTWKNMELEVS